MRPVSLFRSAVFRSALVYLCLFSATVLMVVGLIYWRSTASVSRQIDATIDAEIRGLAEQYDQRGLVGLVNAIERRSGSARETRGLYLLTDWDYRPLAGNLSRWPDVDSDSDGWITFRIEHPDPDGAGINFGRAQTFEVANRFHLLVGNDTRERTRIAAVIQDSLFWGIAAAIGLSLIGTVLLSRVLLRRIDAINRTSRDIMAGDLSRRVPVSARHDEFDRLAENLNAMLDQIERLLNGMKQVTDNIAHDLRSPLGRLRNQLEAALDGGADAPADRRTIEDAIAQADALLRTFTALLSIAQAEAGAPRRHFRPVALAELVGDVADLYRPLAEDKGLSFAVEVRAPCEIKGDRDLLFQALANLLDNGIKYSDPGGAISLSLDREEDGAAILTVADRGPGIPAEAREQVLERFHRLDASRSTPGSGLGLSLVAAVATLHTGRLALADNDPGLRAELRLPAPPDVLAAEPKK